MAKATCDLWWRGQDPNDEWAVSECNRDAVAIIRPKWRDPVDEEVEFAACEGHHLSLVELSGLWEEVIEDGQY